MPTKPKRPELTAERLRELIDYDPKTGRMFWKVARAAHVPAGSEAGSVNGRGYVYVMIDGRAYKRARLAWLWATGRWPEHEIDHRNGAKDDDRLSNLRDVTRAENSRNTRAWSRHGVKGVCFHARRRERPWEASIYPAGKHKSLGYFDTKAEAAEAYTQASKTIFGRFANSRRRPEGKRYVSVADQRLGNQLVDMMFADEAASDQPAPGPA